jgi:iron complex transport system permease protein
VIIQNVLSNKLASPSVIGVNAGAGFAVTLCTALSLYSGVTVSIFAFAGAFLTVMVVSIASKKWGASRSAVILIGVAANSLLGAFSDTVSTFVPEVSVLSNDFKIGDFSSVTYERLIPAAVLIIVSSIMVFCLNNELDVITLGEEQAKALGLNYELKRTVFLIISAMLSGAAVSIAGLLSFVGLIVPHTIRRIAGNKTSHVLGLSALFGGAFLTFCDTLSRSLFSPYEIPVGIIMAFLGAPFFIFILVKGGKRYA